MGTLKRIRLLLADDHTLVRAGLRSLLAQLDDVDVVAEATDGHQTLELVAAHRPDMVLLDIAMPGLNGLDTAAHIARDFPAVKVVVLSMHATREYVRRALRAGALGYVLKDAAVPELELAVRSVARGDIYLSPAASTGLVQDWRAAGAGDVTIDELTSRQREVLQMIAEGQTSKEIASRLGIGLKTVETHRAELMGRLDIHDVPGLVRYAIRTGLVNPDR
jgi:DNA-binding NarL/FixJ family response regulator